MTTPDYPEHQKLRAVKEKSQACGEFLEWLMAEKGIDLVDQETEERHTLKGLLAEFFEIDEDRLETEKRTMLARLRGVPDDDEG